MNTINSAYHLTVTPVATASETAVVKTSFWRRAMNVLSQAGMAALIVG